MLLPKKLQPVTEREILDEVSKELNIDIKDINRTYDIWLQFLNHIAYDTDQATIALPHIGKMYVSSHKMIRKLNTERLRKFKERKSREIDKLKENCRYIVHDKVVPIILKYGIAKRKLSRVKGIVKDFYTPKDLINKQNEAFFREDKDFSEQKKLIKYFIDEEDI